MTCRYDAASSQPNIQIERPKHHFPMATTGSPTNTVSHMGDSGRPRPSSDSKPRLNNAAARQRSWAEWDRRSATRGTGTGPGLLLTDALPSASTLDGRVRQRKGAYPGEFSEGAVRRIRWHQDQARRRGAPDPPRGGHPSASSRIGGPSDGG